MGDYEDCRFRTDAILLVEAAVHPPRLRDKQRANVRHGPSIVVVMGLAAGLGLFGMVSILCGQARSSSENARIDQSVHGPTDRKDPENVLRGRVQNCAGEPVVGARVDVRGLATTGGGVSTDSDGRYAVPVGECGPFVVRVGAVGPYLGTWMDGVMADNELKLTVRWATAVRIRLIEAQTGQPMPCEKVTYCTCPIATEWYYRSKHPHSTQWTDSQGELVLRLERGVRSITIAGEAFQTVIGPIDISTLPRDGVLDVRVGRTQRANRYVRIVDGTELQQSGPNQGGSAVGASKHRSDSGLPVPGVSLTSGLEVSRDEDLIEVAPVLDCAGVEYIDTSAPGFERQRTWFGSADAGNERAHPTVVAMTRYELLRMRILTDYTKCNEAPVVDARIDFKTMGPMGPGPFSWRSTAGRDGHVLLHGMRPLIPVDVVIWCEGFRPYHKTIEWSSGAGFGCEQVQLQTQDPLELHISGPAGRVSERALVVVNSNEFARCIQSGRDGVCRIACWDKESSITVVARGCKRATTTCDAVQRGGGRLVLEASGSICGRVIDSDGATQAGVIIIGGATDADGWHSIMAAPWYTAWNDHHFMRGLEIAVSDNFGVFRITGGAGTRLLALYPIDFPYRVRTPPILCEGDLSRIVLRVP